MTLRCSETLPGLNCPSLRHDNHSSNDNSSGIVEFIQRPVACHTTQERHPTGFSSSSYSHAGSGSRPAAGLGNRLLALALPNDWMVPGNPSKPPASALTLDSSSSEHHRMPVPVVLSWADSTSVPSLRRHRGRSKPAAAPGADVASSLRNASAKCGSACRRRSLRVDELAAHEIDAIQNLVKHHSPSLLNVPGLGIVRRLP